MKVELIDHMGSDLTVVNAARVSLDKHHDIFDKSDEGLINFLARNHHWTPFSHPQLQLRITVPIFVANQLKTHRVGLTVNEVSRRYVDSEPEFYIPDKLGARAENKKQGAKEGEFVRAIDNYYATIPIKKFLQQKFRDDVCYYTRLLDSGVAPEDARIVLPMATYTSWYWTGSLYAFSRIYNLRSKPDSQRQTQEIAQQLSDLIQPLFPFSWKALTERG